MAGNGGPAFPSQHCDSDGNPQEPDDGLNKRDYFAIHAEVSCGEGDMKSTAKYFGIDPVADMTDTMAVRRWWYALEAKLRYEAADAMLAERAKGPK